jgi:hypothetical protein
MRAVGTAVAVRRGKGSFAEPGQGRITGILSTRVSRRPSTSTHTSSMRRIGGLSKRSKSVSVRRTTASAQRGGNVKGPTERSVRIRVLATIASATIAANSGDCSWRPPEPTQVGESPHPTTCALLTRPRVESRRAPRAEPANGALVPHSSSATFYRLPTTVAFGDQFRDREAEFGRPGW